MYPTIPAVRFINGLMSVIIVAGVFIIGVPQSANSGSRYSGNFSQASDYFDAKKYDDAVRELSVVVAGKNVPTKDLSWAYGLRGESELHLGKMKDAENDFLQAVAVFPEGSQDFSADLGNLYEREGDYKKAIIFYNGALDSDNLRPDFRANILQAEGRLYSLTGDHYLAIDAYTRTIVEDPNNLQAYKARAYEKFTLKDYEGARDDYAYVVDKAPDDDFTKVDLATTDHELSKPGSSNVMNELQYSYLKKACADLDTINTDHLDKANLLQYTSLKTYLVCN
ncbi:MAG: Tetratricopeptide repeat protein [Patescibacteria group bacterium]|nr:Tetratricopeptide repeat protein [Patescibacteria group bacterium]